MKHKTVLILFVISFLITACQPATPPADTGDITADDGMPADSEDDAMDDGMAPDGQRNTDLFKGIDELDVETEAVEYASAITGFLARPEGRGVYPGVILIHEWWGLNDNIKDMAKLLAAEGYVVLAVDLYEGKVAETSDDARILSTKARDDQAASTANMRAAAAYLRERDDVNEARLASLGWCFGGGQSLNLALSGEEMAATVIYYGQLETDTNELRSIQWPVLGIFGDEDTSIPVSQVAAFDEALSTLGVEHQIEVYEGVGHAFANPSGANYAPEETVDAWEKTVAFLAESLKPQDTGMTADEPDVIFKITGENFKFVMDGQDNPTLRVRQGDTVRIEFTSTSGFHDWVVDEFDARTEQVRAPDSSSVTFVADEKGEFEYYCSVGKHRANGMWGKLIVE